MHKGHISLGAYIQTKFFVPLIYEGIWYFIPLTKHYSDKIQ